MFKGIVPHTRFGCLLFFPKKNLLLKKNVEPGGGGEDGGAENKIEKRRKTIEGEEKKGAKKRLKWGDLLNIKFFVFSRKRLTLGLVAYCFFLQKKAVIKKNVELKGGGKIREKE